jgi:hypothetical protein
MFLNSLKKDKKLQDWQFTQADNAVKLYIHHFLSESGGAAKLSFLSPLAGVAAGEISRILGVPDTGTRSRLISI